MADPKNLRVLRKIPQACADLDAQLVLALGKWNDNDKHTVRDKLGSFPGDPLIVDFAPQLALLEKASVLITHSGINTVMEALTRRVPMVALPRSADQPGMGARVEYSGVGLRGSFAHSTPQQVTQLVDRVLREDTYRNRAGELNQAITATGGLNRAGQITEQALTTGQPVI
jgi:MGT family glycosyltransferase